MIGRIASGGVFMQPHMLKDAHNVGDERRPIAQPTAEKINDANYGVVNEPGGTAGQLRLAGIELSGKSGTAQVIGYDTLARIHKQKKFDDNAWFVGYAPRRNPEIVVSVLVQESGKHGGEAAGPVVRDVIKAYYDKKNKKQGQYTAETKPPAPRTKPLSTAVRVPRAPGVALKKQETVSTATVRPVAEREP